MRETVKPEDSTTALMLPPPPLPRRVISAEALRDVQEFSLFAGLGVFFLGLYLRAMPDFILAPGLAAVALWGSIADAWKAFKRHRNGEVEKTPASARDWLALASLLAAILWLSVVAWFFSRFWWETTNARSYVSFAIAVLFGTPALVAFLARWRAARKGRG